MVTFLPYKLKDATTSSHCVFQKITLRQFPRYVSKASCLNGCIEQGNRKIVLKIKKFTKAFKYISIYFKKTELIIQKTLNMKRN